MQGWRLGNADMICSCHAPDSVILNAWEEIQGYDQFRISVDKYTQNFADTAVEVHRVIYDGQNIALNQTWTCTNRLTGKRAGDQDLDLGGDPRRAHSLLARIFRWQPIGPNMRANPLWGIKKWLVLSA